jgi:anti-anti-sigma regulatory factor
MASTRKSRRTADAAATAEPVTVAEPVIAEPQAAEPLVPDARPGMLQLGSSLTIREVSEYAAQLKPLLARGHTDIDASRLESVDTAGIQLLLAAAAAAQRRGFKLKLLGALGLKTGAARSLGLNEHLDELAEIVP